MAMKLKMILGGIGIVFVLGLVGSYIYMYNMIGVYKDRTELYIDRYDELKTEQQRLVDHIEENSKKISSNLNEQNTIRILVDKQRLEYTERFNNLNTTFNYSSSGERRDLEKLALSKPLMIERRINDASNKVGTEIQNISNRDPRLIDINGMFTEPTKD